MMVCTVGLTIWLYIQNAVGYVLRAEYEIQYVSLWIQKALKKPHPLYYILYYYYTITTTTTTVISDTALVCIIK